MYNGNRVNGTYFEGSIDDVIVFDEELSADLIMELMKAL